MSKIFVNPGHCPGVDPGALNRNNGIDEAFICHEIGMMLSCALINAGYEVMLLQSDNLAGDGTGENVTAAANEWGADIFISLHCNAFNTQAHGTEIYTSVGQTNADLLATCIMEHVTATFQNALTLRSDWSDGDVDKEAGLIVLNHTVMPAVLYEMAFIDNDADLNILLTRKQEMVSALVQGINDYFVMQLNRGGEHE